MDWQSLLTRQEEIENNSMAEGQARFRRTLARAEEMGREAGSGATLSLLRNSIEPLEKALREFLSESRRKRGVKHVLTRWVGEVCDGCDYEHVSCIHVVQPDVAAYMTVKVVLDELSAKRPLREVAMKITSHLMDELRFRMFKSLSPGLFDYKVSRFTTGSYTHMARSLSAVMNQVQCQECFIAKREGCEHLNGEHFNMPQTHRLLLGVKLLDLLMSSTGIIESFQTAKGSNGRRGVRTDMWLVPSKDTVEWLTKRNTRMEILWPVAMPMVVPPLPWGPERRGGYRYALRNKYPLIRGVYYWQDIQKFSMPTVYSALNRIQETPWKINPAVYDLVMEMRERGGGMAGIPLVENETMPSKPLDIDTNPEARRKWRHDASVVKDRNHMRYLKAVEVDATVQMADRFKDEPVFWFPYSLDFRGRVYPLTPYLHPQGPDLARGLLTFAEGKPLGAHGASWLALHGASKLDTTPTTMGGFKMNRLTLQERVDWIVGHTNEIEAAAKEPFVNRWWMEAEKPFQFYAFCVEWAEYARMARMGRGQEYVCSLPCAMDGTCNGLQHFAALLRDADAGAEVNLVPLESPKDIYQRIAEAVLAILERDAADNQYARLWLSSGLVDRKLCKQPTMTFPYGSKVYGFSTQIHTKLKESDDWHRIKAHFVELTEDGDTRYVGKCACEYMAEVVWAALGDTVVSAMRGMEWLQRAAREAVKAGNIVAWRVPLTEFPVRQGYIKKNFKQVKTTLAGRVVQPSVLIATPRINAKKQAAAVSPNVIHSFDAACLMRTVTLAGEGGIDCFQMVHDSYGALPADCEFLAQCTRQAFVQFYQHDVAADLHRQFEAQAKDPSKVPEPPNPGALDISGVLASTYFFS